MVDHILISPVSLDGQPAFEPVSRYLSPGSKSATQPEVKRRQFQDSGQQQEIRPAATPLPDISLQFEFDSENNELTVFILDITNKKVIRTIPPEELARLHEGELVELFG